MKLKQTYSSSRRYESTVDNTYDKIKRPKIEKSVAIISSNTLDDECLYLTHVLMFKQAWNNWCIAAHK